jgi:hypothetical protein
MGPQFNPRAFDDARQGYGGGTAYTHALGQAYRRKQASRNTAIDNSLEGLYQRKMPAHWYQPAAGEYDAENPFNQYGPGAAFHNPQFSRLIAQYNALLRQRSAGY